MSASAPTSGPLPKGGADAGDKPLSSEEEQGSQNQNHNQQQETKESDRAPTEDATAESGAKDKADLGPSVVSEERKKDLLKKARADRRKWIHAVPLPYRPTVRDPNNVWTLEDRLSYFQASPACDRIPSATKILSELYGLDNHSKAPETIADRIESIVGPLNGDDINEYDDEAKGGKAKTKLENIEGADYQVITAYREFWSTLLRPDCALFVQSMRNYQRSLIFAESLTMEQASKSIKSFLDSTYESIKNHPSWSGRVDDSVRRSLESFLYGQFQPVFERMEWNGMFTMSEKEWLERLAQLQFIGPSHLDIGCLNVDDTSKLHELLAEPIRAVLAIDRYFSPREKLHQVLWLYKAINESLTGVLNTSNDGDERKLPSADDVLPMMILVVLRARPELMFRNLQLIEMFCPPSYLRGEAGYAYTNLYGAVQFLNDLDMEHPESLSISADEFRKGLESRKQDAEQRLTASIGSGEITNAEVPSIRIQDVRAARLCGDMVNLQWVLEKLEYDKMNGAEAEHDNTPSTDYLLPKSFPRSFTFLGAQPDDIKLSDLPVLLGEYRNLIQITEHLVNERATRLTSERRQKEYQKKKLSDERLLLDDDSISEARKRNRALTS